MKQTHTSAGGNKKAEELKLQMHLSGKEAMDEFEKQKKEISHWAAATRKRLDGKGHEGYASLQAKLEELELQTALATAERKDAMRGQQQKLSRSLMETRAEVEAFAKKGKGGMNEFAEKAKDQISVWQTRFDILKLQLHLGAKEAGEEWGDTRDKLNYKIEALEAGLEKAREEGKLKWEDARADIGKTWKDLRKTFS
jgi:hypothetical protein